MNKENILKNINIKNRKASFEYHFIETYVAGIMLTGTEIKSVRQGKVNMQDGFCFFTEKGDLWVKQINISEYTKASFYNHTPTRERKLLLKKKELRKLEDKAQEKGLTIIPIRMFINDRGFAKLEIALAKGKKLFDKRDDIKEKDTKRELNNFKIK